MKLFKSLTTMFYKIFNLKKYITVSSHIVSPGPILIVGTSIGIAIMR